MSATSAAGIAARTATRQGTNNVTPAMRPSSAAMGTPSAHDERPAPTPSNAIASTQVDSRTSGVRRTLWSPSRTCSFRWSGARPRIQRMQACGSAAKSIPRKNTTATSRPRRRTGLLRPPRPPGTPARPWWRGRGPRSAASYRAGIPARNARPARAVGRRRAGAARPASEPGPPPGRAPPRPTPRRARRRRPARERAVDRRAPRLRGDRRSRGATPRSGRRRRRATGGGARTTATPAGSARRPPSGRASSRNRSSHPWRASMRKHRGRGVREPDTRGARPCPGPHESSTSEIEAYRP